MRYKFLFTEKHKNAAIQDNKHKYKQNESSDQVHHK